VIFAVFDLSPLTLCINCRFLKHLSRVGVQPNASQTTCTAAVARRLRSRENPPWDRCQSELHRTDAVSGHMQNSYNSYNSICNIFHISPTNYFGIKLELLKNVNPYVHAKVDAAKVLNHLKILAWYAIIVQQKANGNTDQKSRKHV